MHTCTSYLYSLYYCADTMDFRDRHEMCASPRKTRERKSDRWRDA